MNIDKKAEISRKNEPPVRPLLEEIGNSVTHGIGAALSIAGFILLLLKSDTGLKVMASLFYGICLILLFTMSCLYHSFKGGSKVKKIWRRFDYSSIYLLIGGTFAPMFLVYWGDRRGIILFVLQWTLIVTGVSLIGTFGPARFKPVHFSLYLLLGWSALMFLPSMLKSCVPLFALTLGGGVLYTIGCIPFAMKKKGAHFIWHFFVLFGAAAQWFGIYYYVY